MQSQLTLKLFTFYILKSQFKKKQYIIYFYKNTLLNNFLLNFSYKYTNICIQNPYINYINIVLPFFNKLIQQNYLIFFKTFQSFKKQNKQIIKKNQKRYLNNFSLNSFVKKKQQNNQLILNSFNFWSQNFNNLNINYNIIKHTITNKSTIKITKKLYIYCWFLQNKTKQNKNQLHYYPFVEYLQQKNKIYFIKFEKNNKLKTIEYFYNKLLNKQKYSKSFYNFKKYAIDCLNQKNNSQSNFKVNFFKKLKWLQNFTIKYSLSNNLSFLITDLNLNNTELKTFLNLKINNLTLYQNKYKESLIQNIKIQNQPTQSAFDNTHNLSIQQNSIPLSNNLTLNTATKKLNILELVREKKKKQINLSTTDLNLPIINDNLQLINNQIQKQKFNFIKNNILKIKNINKLNINKIRINKSKINKLKIKTYNIITFAKNNLITNYLKLNSIFFKLLNINQFFLIINYLLYQFNLILLKNKKFKIYNFFKLNNILKQIIIKNPDFTFGLHTTFLNKIKTIKLNYLKHSLLDFNSKTSILCKKIILLINKNYTYKNTNTLKYVLKKQIYLKYKKLLNNYQNNLIKKKNLLNYNYIYYKLYQNNKLKLKKKNFKNFFFKSLHFTTTYNLQKLILLKKSHTYIKYITKKINKKKIKHLLQMFKIYIFIFKSYFVNFRNFKNNFYIKNKIKLNSNKWNSLFNYSQQNYNKKVVNFLLKNLIIKEKEQYVTAQILKINKYYQQPNYLKLNIISSFILEISSFFYTTILKKKINNTITSFKENLFLSRSCNIFVNNLFTTKFFYFSQNWLYGDTKNINTSTNISKYSNILYYQTTNNTQDCIYFDKFNDSGLSLNYINKLRLLKVTSIFLLNKFITKQQLQYNNYNGDTQHFKNIKIVPFFVPEILPQTKILKYKNNENYLKYNLILEKIPYINKNIFLQKKNNYNLKISRFFFNNQLIVFNKLKYQTINNFENHRSQRIHRRFWPMQSTLKNQKDCINKIQNKENFLILLKNIYVISKKNINLNFLHSSKIDQTKLQFKNMFLMDNFTSASLNFLNKDLSFDVGKKFIQILWKAQKYHKHIFQKQILCNRWRFKTKFWIWFKKANKTQPLTFKSAIKELPSLTTLLSQTNFFYNKLFLKRLIAFNGILINGFPLKNLFFKLLLGDIIQLSPNIKVLDNYTNFLTKQQHIKSQYIKNINKVITVSQWRQRKEIQPNTFNTFLKNNNNFIPYWTQVDLFISALTPIKHPKTLLGVQHEDNNRYMLDKLTPWRLKI